MGGKRPPRPWEQDDDWAKAQAAKVSLALTEHYEAVERALREVAAEGHVLADLRVRTMVVSEIACPVRCVSRIVCTVNDLMLGYVRT